MNLFVEQQLHLGTLTIKTQVIQYLIAAVIAFLIVFFRYYHDKQRRQLFSGTLSSGILILFLGWKVFPLFYSFKKIISEPLAILYSPGGVRGMIFGSFFAILYFLYKIFLEKTDDKRNRKMLEPLLIFLSSFVIISLLLFGFSRMVRPETEEKSAFIFTSRTAGGHTISLEDFKGKTLVLNFWATWCPPCRGEIPTLISFEETLKGTNTILLGINASSTEKSVGAVKDFIKKKGINYPVILDTDGSISAAYAVQTLPTTIIVNPEGKIKENHTGAVDYFWLRSYLTGNP